MIANPHRVAEKQWRKWSGAAQVAFNEHYERVRRAQALMLHPATPPMPQGEWDTVAWNVAWLVADAIATLPMHITTEPTSNPDEQSVPEMSRG